jgi:hypothetical protein
MLRFEKRNKSLEISVRQHLRQMIAAYIEAAGLQDATKDAPLFRAGQHAQTPRHRIHVNDVYRMMKRRPRVASLPARLSPQSLRVAVITGLLEQGRVPRRSETPGRPLPPAHHAAL